MNIIIVKIFPALLILLAYSLKDKKILQILIIATFLVSSVYYLFTPKFHREDWRGLVAFVNSGESDSTVLFPADSQMEAYNFYSQNYLQGVKAFGPEGFSDKANTIWLTRYVNDIFDPNDSLKNKIESSNYQKRAEIDFNGIVVWKYTKNK